MLFIRQPQTVDDIRKFCATFDENIRVEYKRHFDANVRARVPKIVSSFANSLGGVLIIGVNAPNGVAQQPIEGFQQPQREELPLTVENLCLQHINPPVLPRSFLVPGSTQGNVFLVVEVDESWEAPHAVENSKQVYVRTGVAANPYEVADVDLIIELVRRREKPTRLREDCLAHARRRASIPVADASPHIEVFVSPPYPRHALSSPDDTWNFLAQMPYRRDGGRPFPLQTLRRIEGGTASFTNDGYAEVSNYGLLLGRKVFSQQAFSDLPGQRGPQCLDFRDVFHLALKLVVCADRFYRTFGYRGNVIVEGSVHNAVNEIMPFVYPTWHFNPDEFRCIEPWIAGSQTVAADNLREGREQLLISLLSQLCWPFWQSQGEFPIESLSQWLQRALREMNIV